MGYHIGKRLTDYPPELSAIPTTTYDAGDRHAAGEASGDRRGGGGGGGWGGVWNEPRGVLLAGRGARSRHWN